MLLNFRSAIWSLNCKAKPQCFESLVGNTRGILRIRQKHRHLMDILKPTQKPYIPKPLGYQPLPKSLLTSGPFKRLFKLNSLEARQIIKRIDFDQYQTREKGVRWHPSGGFFVQYKKQNFEKNFAVNCRVLFRPRYFGFQGARKMAIQFRRRLQREWEELEHQWEKIDRERQHKQMRDIKRKKQIQEQS